MIQINLLTTSNPVYATRLESTIAALVEFFSISDANRSKVKFRLICHEQSVDSWKQIVYTNDVDGIDVAIIGLPSDEYMLKVEFMKQTDCEYMCKWDDDVFINRHVWDYMIENIHTLDDPKHYVMSPIFTNGIPSVDLFIEDFLSSPLNVDYLSSLFIKEGVVPEIWGCNYAPLNEQIAQMKYWDGREYWKMVAAHDQTANRSVPWFYHIVKGVHPARFSFEYNMFIANFTKNHRDLVLAERNYWLDDTFFTPYFCNNLFFSTTAFYRESQNQFFDHWDEGQLTLLAQKNNQVPVYVRNSYGIHMAYGCTPRQKEIEAAFCEFFSSIL